MGKLLKTSNKIKVLMFGWEFPPFNSGGLGTACQGLVGALVKQGIAISFVLPKKMDCRSSQFKIIFAGLPLKIKSFNSLLSPYLSSASYRNLVNAVPAKGVGLSKAVKDDKEQNIYRPDLVGEVKRYAEEAPKIALSENFDFIHAHDWLSFPAGLAAKKVSNKPLIVHVHATEFDRTGDNYVNQSIYEIEKEGLEKADIVIAVSNFTKNKIIEHYGIKPEKIRVIYNAVEPGDFPEMNKNSLSLKADGKKVVLFVGRITLQKGPDYFLRAAKKVLEYEPDVFFLIAGSGDMEIQIIEEAAKLKIADKVLFTGFLRGDDLIKIYQTADLYVLPSVSEPFGITALEALVSKTPVLISKQSGVSETLSHCLKADFWDIDEMANKILAVLKYPALYQCLRENGAEEVKKFSWQDSARKCVEVYNEIAIH